MPRTFVVLAASLLLIWPVGAGAKSPTQATQGDPITRKVFSDLERRVIRQVLGGGTVEPRTGDRHMGDRRMDDREDRHGKRGNHGKGAPPGLAKRDQLPPGLQMQLERNGHLPPGLEGREFPRELRARLPSPLQGTRRVIIGNDAVLVDVATNVILDVIHDVIRNSSR